METESKRVEAFCSRFYSKEGASSEGEIAALASPKSLIYSLWHVTQQLRKKKKKDEWFSLDFECWHID